MARALSVGTALMLLVGTGAVAPLSVTAKPAAFDVTVANIDDLAGMTAVIANSPEGVNVRSEPSQDGKILTTLSEGETVALRIDQVDTAYDADGTRWWPVTVDGRDGWISGLYLGAGSSSSTKSASASSSSSSASASAENLPKDTFTVNVDSIADLSGLTARVKSSGGVNLRAGASLGSDVVGTAPDGEVVSLRVDQVDSAVDTDGNRWWPVSYDGVDGWVVGAYLADAGGAKASSSSSSKSSSEKRDAVKFSAGDYASAKTKSGTGVNVRADGAPDAERIGYIPEGNVVQVMDGPVYDDTGNGWYKVTDGDVTGYADGDLLVAAKAPEKKTTKASKPKNEPAKFKSGDYAAAKTASGIGVNIRSGASAGSSRVGSIAERAIAQVVSGPYYDDNGAGWYEVDYGGIDGFVDGDLLVASKAPAAPQTQAASTGPTGILSYPVSGAVLTQAYGCTGLALEPYNASLGCNFHNGIDLAVPAYTPIHAADGGTVTAAGWCDCGLGYYVTIDHGNGIKTTYGHMAEMPYVAVGQAVNKGDVIGPVGSTGASTGPHLHFIVEVNGSTVDPLGYLS
jgi:murein DD-endopeptidase MepM/ murein hydrolase activator NlpD